MVPACSEPSILDTCADGSVLFEQAKGDATQDGEVLGTVIFAQTALIFAEGDVQDPVEGIFNRPVGAYSMEQLFCVERGAGRDEITTLDGDFRSEPPLYLHFDQGTEVWPVFSTPQATDEFGV